jgi:predicted MFS family arabinose efflux permease
LTLAHYPGASFAVHNTGLTKSAFRFVLLIGIVNFFADLTYEGGRSIIGPFLGALGASATVVGIVAGFGELMGYGLRSVSGYLADKTQKYWVAALCGYAINMLAVPALALAGSWPVAAVLIVTERTGRAIRRPSVESMLSHAGKSIGTGWVFGLNEAMDQAGATLGPLLVALILSAKPGYQNTFALLLIPALLCLASIVVARLLHPRPSELEKAPSDFLQGAKFPKAYWIYVVASALIAAGFADFSLIAFHFRKTATVSENVIPIYYSVAMGSGALGSLIVGRLLDRVGNKILVAVFLLSALFAPLVFFGNSVLALMGMVLWGLSVGAQDSLLKAALTGVIPPRKRSTAFGLFDGVFGIAWFLGSAVMGLLYDKSIVALVLFSVALQLAALPVFLFASKRKSHGP